MKLIELFYNVPTEYKELKITATRKRFKVQMSCWKQLAKTAQPILYLVAPPESASRLFTHFYILISVCGLDHGSAELSPRKDIH